MIDEVSEIIEPVWLVGGAVRDIIRGVEPNDYDFCTPLLPPEVEQRIEAAGRKCYKVGDKFGTLGMHVNGHKVEITTFRKEKYKDGSRHPEVAFTASLEDDLARRDFTVNALAMDISGNIVDLFGGREDLQNGHLKAVGNARERFREDPLRLLRLCRFVAKLDMDVEGTTLQDAIRLAGRITQTSRNRWVPELDSMLMCSEPAKGFRLAQEIGILKFILPELALQWGYDQRTPYHGMSLFEHTMQVVELASGQSTPELRWAALLHDIGKPYVAREKSKTFERDGEEIPQWTYVDHAVVGAELVQGIAARLHWAKVRTDTVGNLVLNHLSEDSPLREYDSKAR